VARSGQVEKADVAVPPPPAGGFGSGPPSPSDLESLTLQIGRDLLRDVRGHRGGVLSAGFWSNQLLNWAWANPSLKVPLFRFIDVFPMLTTAEQVHDYLLDYLGRPEVSLPAAIALGLRAGGLAKGVLTKAITRQITTLAANFIAGTDAASSLDSLRRLWQQGMAFSVDLLGEACVSDGEARAYRRRYLDLIETLPEHVRQWPANPRLEADDIGPVPRTNISIKISSLHARTDAIDFEGSLGRLLEAVRPLLMAAQKHGVLINFDMEQHALKDLTIELFQRCCQQIDFPAGLALQAYLRSAEEDAERIIAWARRSGRQVTIRLIKGAYWDYEVIDAERMGWPPPVWTSKRDTDACFERMAERLVAALPRRADEGGVKLAVGSHNLRSIARTLALLKKYNRGESAVEFQVLFGMGQQLQAALAQRGLRVRQYVPIGQMLPGMAYLVRRLLENSSNQSWLHACLSESVSGEELLASPHDAAPTPTQLKAPTAAAAERHQLSRAVAGLGDGRTFVNEPLRDFSRRQQRERFAEQIRLARLPAIDREATVQEAEGAVVRSATAFPAWRDRGPLERSAILVAAAAGMRRRRDELSGVVIRESGKTWREADADVCEAIDYCEYYARRAVDLFQPQRLGRFVGEWNETWYQPRGVAVVISPWNFPLAICTGMTAAALATGNTAILKPSSRTRGIARLLCEILWQTGAPAEVLQFLPGGGPLGAALVRHPRVALVAFTGSKQVGLSILEAAGHTPDEQGFVKKVVCEMGGKNAIIVDESADLDEAVLGVRQSAFSYSGQKCSACSRAIVVDAVHDLFLRRLCEATQSLVIGDPMDPGTDVGPVIDRKAAEKIRRYIEIGKDEGRLEVACEAPAGLAERVGKPYIGPHIFSGIQPQHRLASEEIFGPVLSVMRVADFPQALAVANATAYKLTGGVFSRKAAHLDMARRDFRVGNLYLNRGITGALVGRQPFGGFGLSGTGTKAGGADYLLHFVEPRCSTENTMRHGFAPGLD
jgi:RHH-type proline utilization regulon transcriptional repressor/proline dehydrogenase/delta 1-pyrroline-5-carboxylate dehydrogenase